MKKIPLKKIEQFDYREALLGILRNPPRERGFSMEDVRQAVKAIEAIELSKTDTVMLEDAVYEFLIKCIQQTRYVTAGKELVQFFEDMEKAESVKVKE